MGLSKSTKVDSPASFVEVEFIEGKSASGRSETVFSVVTFSEWSETRFAVFSSVLVFIGVDSEDGAGKSTMRDHDRGHERAR